MKTVTIDPALKEKIPGFCVAVLSFEIEGVFRSSALAEEIKLLEQEILAAYTLETLLQDPRILAGRNGYKALGKDSSHSPPWESMMRRLMEGSGIDGGNDIVDIGNILSVKARRSVAVMDEERLQGDVLIGIGISRGVFDKGNIPLYMDGEGPFGSLASGSLRSRITEHTRQVLLFMTSFNGKEGLHEDARLAIDYYTRYGEGSNFLFEIIV